MYGKIKRDLQHLASHDLWCVLTHWRLLLWKQTFRKLPLPGKVGLVFPVVVTGLLPVLPSPADGLPPIFLPIFWVGAYCISFTICLFFPLRKQAVHWVG